MFVVPLMGFWDRFRRQPPPSVVADTRALAAESSFDSSSSTALVRSGDARRAEPEPYERIEQPGSTVWRQYPEEGISPERWLEIQHDADIGYTSRLMELYDAVSNDYHVGSQLRTRKLAVAGAPLTAEPGDKTDPAKKIAEDFSVFWQKIPDTTSLLCDILDDFYRGFSCVRPVWDSIDAKWQIVAHEAVESRYFRFVNATDPIICSMPGGSEGVPVPDGYLYSECRDKAGPVVRAGVGRSVVRLWMYKGYDLVDLAGFLEKHASPHIAINTDKVLKPGDNLLQQIKDAARAFIVDQIGIMPAGATLQVLDAINKGQNVRDVYLAAAEFFDKGISKAIVGQVLTADAGPGGIGHGGAAEEQGDVRQDLKEFDGRRAQHIVQCRIAKPWTLYHYGPNAPVPKICIDVAKPEDRVQATLAEKQRAETVNIYRSSGLKILALPIYAEMGWQAPEDVDETTILEPPAPPPQATDVGDPQKGVPAPPGSAAPNS